MKAVKTLGQNYNKVQTVDEPAIMTGIKIIDDFWSKKGGMVLGSTIFLTGSSGAGKTTLAVFLQATMAHVKTSLYSREMSAGQVREQTDNLNIVHGNDFIADEDSHTHIDEYLASIYEYKPKVVIVDSLQIVAKDYEASKSISESDAIDLVIKNLRKWAKDTSGVVIIVGHVTKGDGFRGDNTIMQMVDAHLEMIYNKKAGTRTISWGQKNRKGVLGEKIYYDFISDGLSFMSESEYKAKKTDVSFPGFIQDMLSTYISTCLNSESDQIDGFIKELTKEFKLVAKKKISNMETVIEQLRLVDSLVKKHNLVK